MNSFCKQNNPTYNIRYYNDQDININDQIIGRKIISISSKIIHHEVGLNILDWIISEMLQISGRDLMCKHINIINKLSSDS